MGLPNREADVRTAVSFTYLFTDAIISLSDRQSAYLNRSEAFQGDVTIWGNGRLVGFLRSTIHVDKHSITRSYAIVTWQCHVHIRFERQTLIVEDVTPPHLLAVPTELFQKVLIHCCGVLRHPVVHLGLHLQILTIVLIVSVCP